MCIYVCMCVCVCMCIEIFYNLREKVFFRFKHPSSSYLPPSLHPSSLPTEIGNCVNLVFLEVQHNNLTALPDSVGSLKALRRLGLRYNNLTSLPASTCECVLLEEISLDNNQLSTLPVRGRGLPVWEGTSGVANVN